MFPVWFACKTCRGSFQKLSDFLDHKKQHHFHEFQSTTSIVFEERGIHSNDEGQTLAYLPTAQNIKQEFSNNGCIDPLRVKVENNCDLSNNPDPELQCLTNQHLETVKTEYQSQSDHDHSKDDLDHLLISSRSKNVTGINSDLCFKPDYLLNSSHAPHDLTPNVSYCTEMNYDIKNKNSASKVNRSAECTDLSSRTHCIQTQQQNPSDIDRRFPPQELQNCSVSDKNTSKKYTVETVSDFSLATDSVQRPFICPIAGCLKVFKSRDCVRSHKKIHLNRRPFKCEDADCGKLFRTKHDLRSHLVRHSDAKPFNCPRQNCEKTFKTKANLIRHLKTHSDRDRDHPPIPCSEAGCSKAFHDKFYLQQHLVTHTGGKPFECTHQDCDKTYKIRGDLTRHLKSHYHSYSPPSKQSTEQIPRLETTFGIETSLDLNASASGSASASSQDTQSWLKNGYINPIKVVKENNCYISSNAESQCNTHHTLKYYVKIEHETSDYD